MSKLISKHLNKENLKIPMHTGIDEQCAFTGSSIREGVKLKDLIKKNYKYYYKMYCILKLILYICINVKH